MNGYGRDHMRELHFRARTDAMITTYFKTPVDVPGLVTSFGLPEFYLRFESPDALKGCFMRSVQLFQIKCTPKEKYFL